MENKTKKNNLLEDVDYAIQCIENAERWKRTSDFYKNEYNQFLKAKIFAESAFTTKGGFKQLFHPFSSIKSNEKTQCIQQLKKHSIKRITKWYILSLIILLLLGLAAGMFNFLIISELIKVDPNTVLVGGAVSFAIIILALVFSLINDNILLKNLNSAEKELYSKAIAKINECDLESDKWYDEYDSKYGEIPFRYLNIPYLNSLRELIVVSNFDSMEEAIFTLNNTSETLTKSFNNCNVIEVDNWLKSNGRNITFLNARCHSRFYRDGEWYIEDMIIYYKPIPSNKNYGCIWAHSYNLSDLKQKIANLTDNVNVCYRYNREAHDSEALLDMFELVIYSN